MPGTFSGALILVLQSEHEREQITKTEPYSQAQTRNDLGRKGGAASGFLVTSLPNICAMPRPGPPRRDVRETWQYRANSRPAWCALGSASPFLIFQGKHLSVSISEGWKVLEK